VAGSVPLLAARAQRPSIGRSPLQRRLGDRECVKRVDGAGFVSGNAALGVRPMSRGNASVTRWKARLPLLGDIDRSRPSRPCVCQ
jgi:hypothetical protein